MTEQDKYAYSGMQTTYWADRVRKAAEYLEYAKAMHRQAIKRLGELALDNNKGEQE